MIICVSVSALISLLLFFESERAFHFLIRSRVIHNGMITMRILVGFYAVLAVHQILMGVMRGAGKSMETMLISVGNMCVLRMIYIKLIIPVFQATRLFMVKLSDNVDYNDSDGYYLYEMGKMEGNSSAMMYSARRFFRFCASFALQLG